MNDKENLLHPIQVYINNIQSEVKQIQELKNQQYQNQDIIIDEYSNQLKQINEEIKILLYKQLQVEQNKNELDYLIQLINNININNDQELYRKQKKKILIRSTIKQQQVCVTTQFNTNTTLFFVGQQSGKIKLYGFNNLNKLIKQLFNHNEIIYSLIWMKKNQQLLSVGRDSSIIFWNNEWKPEQIVQDNQYICCAILNEEEDLLISGGGSINFWRRENQLWSCSQSIQTWNTVNYLSLNPQARKLICLQRKYEENSIGVVELQANDKWMLIQVIKTDRGGQLCFINDYQFIFQPFQQGELRIYSKLESTEFALEKSFLISNHFDQKEQFFLHFLKEINILIIKHNKNIIFLHLDNDNQYQLQQIIEVELKYKQEFLANKVRVSDNGQYLVTWNYKQKGIQIMKIRNL